VVSSGARRGAKTLKSCNGGGKSEGEKSYELLARGHESGPRYNAASHEHSLIYFLGKREAIQAS
jgi:hypothetical protein